MPLNNAKEEAAALKIKTPPKTPAERSRMYRLRKKQLSQGSQLLFANVVLQTPSTSNSPQPVTTENVLKYHQSISNCQLNHSNESGLTMDSSAKELEVPDMSIVKIEITEETEEDQSHLVEIKIEPADDFNEDADNKSIRYNEDKTKNLTTSTVTENPSIEVTAKREPEAFEMVIKNEPSINEDVIVAKLEPKVELTVEDKVIPNLLIEKLNRLKCAQCDRTFKNKICFKRHLRNTAHEGKSMPVHKCEVCQKVLTTKYNLKIHMRQMHSNEDLSIICLVCNKVFKTDLLLKRHTRWSHGSVYQCVTCNKTLSSLLCYKTHLKNVHSEAELKICDICGKGFKRKDHLARHIHYTHYNMKPLAKKYRNGEVPCSICHKRFETKQAMRRHLERSHDNGNAPNNRNCHICGEEMCDPTSLRRHFEQVHPTETATCSVCMKVFKSHMNLQRHMEVTHAHPDEAKDCSICKESFECMAHLTTHMHIVHNKEGPLECDICGKKFSSKINMDKHKKLHDVNKEVECNICGKIFKSLLRAKKHQRKIHQNKHAKKKETSEADEGYEKPEKHPNSSGKLIVSADDINSTTVECDSILPFSLVEVKIESISD